mmetsp:Transcript_73324/g.172296  ORF Transcript_73324/g.172296 Transcript_73324/m.172296 type:complete len:231 (+) Transcript_73324:137-829(+)
MCRENKAVLKINSTDFGKSWGAVEDLSASVVGPSWTWVATGPPGGISLASGRLAVAADHNNKSGAFSHVMLSDDKGVTWFLGGSVADGNECQVAQLPNQQLVLNMRTPDHTQRRLAWSDDQGLSFHSSKLVPALPEPRCEGSMISLGQSLVMSNPTSASSRTNMALHISSDGGVTWTLAATIWSGPSAYSSLSSSASQLNLAFERGHKSPYETISFNLCSLSADSTLQCE